MLSFDWMAGIGEGGWVEALLLDGSGRGREGHAGECITILQIEDAIDRGA